MSFVDDGISSPPATVIGKSDAGEPTSGPNPVSAGVTPGLHVIIDGGSAGGGSANATDTTVAPAALTTVAQTLEIVTTGKASAAFNVTANTNVTLLFEALTPDGTNWVGVSAYPFSGGAGVSSVPANGVGAWVVPCGAFGKVRVRVSAVGASPTATVAALASAASNDQLILNLLQGSLPLGTNSIGNLNSPVQNTYIGHVSTEGLKATYRYEAVALVPAATPTDLVLLQGSSTKVIKVKRVLISGEATAAAQMTASMIRRSTAGSGGTATTITPARSDNTDAVATAVLKVFTANLTAVGTAIATMIQRRVGLNPPAGLPASPVEISFGIRNDEPFVLRGTSDFLAINLAGAAVPAGGKIDIAIEWTEE
jgi:hypothetical protein